MNYEEIQKSGIPSVAPMQGWCVHCKEKIYWDVHKLAWRDGLIVDGHLTFLAGRHFAKPDVWM